MKRIYSIGLAAALTAACGAGGGDDDKDENNDGNDGGTGEVGSLALSDFSLSDSITAPIPDQLSSDDSSSSLNLTAGKSLEQCLLRDAIAQMEMNVAQVTSQLCMFENTPGIEWGGKYEISFDMDSAGGPDGGGGDAPPADGPGELPLTQTDTGDADGGLADAPADADGGFADAPADADGGFDAGTDGFDAGADGGLADAPDAGGADAGGADAGGPGDIDFPEAIQIYMDDTKSADGMYKVWVCEDGTLTQSFTISGAKKGEGSKGKYNIKMNIGGDEMLLAGSFDNGLSTEGRYLGDVRMRFKFGEFSANNYIKMNLGKAADDIHFVRSANEFGGSLFGGESDTTKELLAGRIGPDFGMALVQRTGGDQPLFGLTQETAQTSRAYFDGDGMVVGADADAAFAEGGDLHVTKEEMPRLLPEFKVEFGEGAWDCSGTTALDMDAAGGGGDMEQCFEGMDAAFNGLGCFDGGFEVGAQEEGFEDFTGDEARYDDNFEGGEFDDFPDDFVPPPEDGDVPPPEDGEVDAGADAGLDAGDTVEE